MAWFRKSGLSGNQAGGARFVQSIERRLRLVVVESIDVTANATQLQLNLYYR
jgi:hypothetical protein